MTADYKTMKAHARFEQACVEQAKAELEAEANSGIDFAIRLLRRAQQIKRLRIDEAMFRLWEGPK